MLTGCQAELPIPRAARLSTNTRLRVDGTRLSPSQEQALCRFKIEAQCCRLEVDQGSWLKEGRASKMLSLEIIGVLGALFAFLVYGMVRTQLARRQAEAKRKAEEGAPAATQKAR
jgi:hypothetical protein